MLHESPIRRLVRKRIFRVSPRLRGLRVVCVYAATVLVEVSRVSACVLEYNEEIDFQASGTGCFSAWEHAATGSKLALLIKRAHVPGLGSTSKKWNRNRGGDNSRSIVAGRKRSRLHGDADDGDSHCAVFTANTDMRV